MTYEAVHTVAAVASLIERRSVSPKRLAHPGPDLAEIDLILQAALRAPDHGGLHPWRVIEFQEDQRAALGDAFKQEKLRRDPLASAFDLHRARDHALIAPVLMAFIVSPRARSKVPVQEQWLASGAALCNLLNAAHLLGYGAIVLSGERCFDAVLLAELGVARDEHLAGFITIGRIIDVPPGARSIPSSQVWSCWNPEAARTAAATVPIDPD